MIIWGSRNENKDLGVVQTKFCEVCEKQRPFKVMLFYKWSHLYWLFGQVSEKQYSLVCDVCGRGQILENHLIEATLVKNPIPFMRRYGWLVPAGLFLYGVLVLCLAISKSNV